MSVPQISTFYNKKKRGCTLKEKVLTEYVRSSPDIHFGVVGWAAIESCHPTMKRGQ